MRLRLLLFLILSIGVVIVPSFGCASSVSQNAKPEMSPQDAFVAAFKAANAGNYSQAEQYLSRTATAFNEKHPFARGRADDWDRTTQKRTVKGIGLRSTENAPDLEDLPEGSTLIMSMKIYFSDGSINNLSTTDLVKENGTWRIKEWDRQHHDFLEYPCSKECDDPTTYISLTQ